MQGNSEKIKKHHKPFCAYLLLDGDFYAKKNKRIHSP